MNKVLLFSGGMDSYIAYHYLSDKFIFPDNEVLPIYIDYNGRYCKKEKEVVKKLLPQTVIVDNYLDLYYLEDEKTFYLPNRNIYLLTMASNYGDNIMFGGLKDDNVGDKSYEFSKLMSSVLTQSLGREVKVDSPFWGMEKIDILRWYYQHIGSFSDGDDPIMHTTSCYHPTETYCGRCASCFRKACAFQAVGVNLAFYNDDLALNYYKNRFKYTRKRVESIETICKRLGVAA
jgi:7-cyano-7-deazaguanine synthase